MNKERLKSLLSEYGTVAISTYLVIFVLVLGAFTLALGLGFEVQSAAGGAGLLGGAWLATKLTQPLRILATLALTPVVARVVRRGKPPGPRVPSPPGPPTPREGEGG